jgi:hypothetical protein
VFIDPTVIIISTKTDDSVQQVLDPDGKSEASEQGDRKLI